MKYFVRWLIKVGVYAGIVIVLFSVIFGIRINYGNDMYPSVRDGDLVITYRLQQPQKDDVVAYKTDEGIAFGRITGTAGDIVDISDNGKTITINDEDNDTFFATDPGESLEYPYVVPKNSYFILNDYRPSLDDSRTFAAVSRKQIKGTVIFVIRRRGF